jgi:hypothetical protein
MLKQGDPHFCFALGLANNIVQMFTMPIHDCIIICITKSTINNSNVHKHGGQAPELGQLFS